MPSSRTGRLLWFVMWFAILSVIAAVFGRCEIPLA